MTESHLVGNNVLSVIGYEWSGDNIKDVYIGTRRKESGGVGVLDKLLSYIYVYQKECPFMILWRF